MKKKYKKPSAETADLMLEGLLCGSGDPICSIIPIEAEVKNFEINPAAVSNDDYPIY